jgi:hypothetical protein
MGQIARHIAGGCALAGAAGAKPVDGLIVSHEIDDELAYAAGAVPGVCSPCAEPQARPSHARSSIGLVVGKTLGAELLLRCGGLLKCADTHSAQNRG